MGRVAQRFAFACASTSQEPCRSSSEHSPPPRPSCALLRLYRNRPGLCPLRLLLDPLRGFWCLCGCFYGRDPRSESRDDAPVLPVALVGLLQLLSEGCDSFVLCGYERSGSRLRLVGVMY